MVLSLSLWFKCQLIIKVGNAIKVYTGLTGSVCFFFFFEGELESAVAELQESNCRLTALKAERDATNGAFFPVLKLGSKHGSGDKVKDKHRNLHEVESSLKELLEQTSSRLTELKSLHEEKIKILQQLSNLQICFLGNYFIN